MTARRPRGDGDTASRILDIAERLVQNRGVNGFSYADVAAELKISKASLPYHFPRKAQLGEALIGRYAAPFPVALAGNHNRGGAPPPQVAPHHAHSSDVPAAPP